MNAPGLILLSALKLLSGRVASLLDRLDAGSNPAFRAFLPHERGRQSRIPPQVGQPTVHFPRNAPNEQKIYKQPDTETISITALLPFSLSGELWLLCQICSM